MRPCLKFALWTSVQIAIRGGLLPASVLIATLLLLAPGAWAQTPTAEACPAFTAEQMHDFTARTLTNQHGDDLLLEQYDRLERDTVHANGKGISSKNTLSHVVPTGTGSMRVELERDGKPTDMAARQQQWLHIAQRLLANSRPDNPETKKDYEKAARRNHERFEMVEAVGKAFRFQCLQRERLQGRTVFKISFVPDSSYRPTFRFSSVFTHVRGTVWVSETSAQIVRLNAELFEDYHVGGGIVAKLDRGGTATLEQQEIEPGVWVPTRTTFDFTGRLFFFPAAYRQLLEESAYRRIGPPREALLVIRQEHPESGYDKLLPEAR